MSFLLSKQRRKIYSKKIKGFWKEYRRSKTGMVGIALIAAFVFVAVAAPWLAPYDPVKDRDLAERMVMPEWMTILVPEYSDLPRTKDYAVNWTVLQSLSNGTKFVDVNFTDFEEEITIQNETTILYYPSNWIIQYNGGTTERIDVWLGWNFTYPYSPMNLFTATFRWRIQGLELNRTDPMYKKMWYNLELLLVRWNGSVMTSLWDSNVRSGHRQIDTSLSYWIRSKSMRDLGWPVLVILRSDADAMLERLGFPKTDPRMLPRETFSEKGEYGLLMHIRLQAKLENATCEINILNTKFRFLGLVHGILGTDQNGADLFSQMVYGTQISLMIGVSTALLAVSVGTFVGVVSGYLGGIADEFSMRIVDIMLSIPVLPLLLLIITIWGPNVFFIIFLLAIFGWQGLARLIRSLVLSIREMAFIESATAAGAGKYYIIFRHVLPQIIPVAFTGLILSVPTAIIAEAVLSFLGFGDPMLPSWGIMLYRAQYHAAWTWFAWWWILPPGLAIMFLCLAFVFIGRAVDEVVNPRLRRRR